MLKNVKSVFFDILAIILTGIFSIIIIYLCGYMPESIVLPFAGIGFILSFWLSHHLVDKLR